MEIVKILLFVMDAIPVPFCVAVAAVGNNRSVGRNGENAPVNKDAKFFLVKPGGDTSFIEGFPVGFIWLSLGAKGVKQGEGKKQVTKHVESFS
jgi:hypothetical protein